MNDELLDESRKERKREIRRQYYLRNRDRLMAKSKAYYAANRDKNRENCKAYRLTHREQLRAYSKEYHRRYYDENRESILAKTRAYGHQHPEVGRRYRQRIRILHPEIYKAREINHKRRRKAVQCGDAMEVQAVAMLIKQWKTLRKFVCYYCQRKLSGSLLEIDHIVPLSKGGAHIRSNLCQSCKSCNRKKNTKSLSELTFVNPLLNL